jgi:predicted nucleic acid-binding protein
MLRLIADSSSLILLAKCGLLERLSERCELVVPLTVVNEVASEDLVRMYPDAALIAELISNGAISVKDPAASEIIAPISLHEGERQALMLAKEIEGALLATDDGKAIKAARFLKIPFIISPRIVTELFRLRAISTKEARHSIHKLGQIGRYSPEIIADALVSLMEQKDGKADDHKDT